MEAIRELGGQGVFVDADVSVAADVARTVEPRRASAAVSPCR
jgi:hypothetical protein